MKVIGEYTCRGTITPSLTDPHKITLFDGRFDTGYRIKKFVVAPYDMDNTNIRTYVGKVATATGLDPREWNWADQREIAWSYFALDANNASNPNSFEQVDMNQIIVEDVYVYADEPGGATSQFTNYYIEFEKVEITDWQGALTMAKDKAMGDD
mgnify:CR=1 FL=1